MLVAGLANGDSTIIDAATMQDIYTISRNSSREREKGRERELEVSAGVNHDFQAIKLSELSNAVSRNTPGENLADLFAKSRLCCVFAPLSPSSLFELSLDTITLLALPGRELIIKR